MIGKSAKGGLICLEHISLKKFTEAKSTGSVKEWPQETVARFCHAEGLLAGRDCPTNLKATSKVVFILLRPV